MPYRRRKNKNKFVWELYFTYKDYSGNTRRFSKSGFSTKKEAEQYYLNHINELKFANKNTFLTISFDELYFLAMDEVKLAENTIRLKNSYYKKYIKSKFGNTLNKEINFELIETIVEYFDKKKVNSNIYNKIISIFKQIFKFAFKHHYTLKDYSFYLKYRRINDFNNSKVKYLTNDQIEILFENFKNKPEYIVDRPILKYYELAIYIGYYTGLRMAEVMALTKSDFDFENNLIYINKQLAYVGLKITDYHVINQLKTKSSNNSVPMTNELKLIMYDWFNKNPQEDVFKFNKKYIRPSMINYHGNVIATHNGFEFHYHLLRHTLATNLIKINTNIKTVQTILRHSDISTTVDTYTHVDFQSEIDAINSIF